MGERWVLNHYGAPKNAAEEFSDWWHACSAMSSACTGGFGTYIGHGLSPNFTTETNFWKGDAIYVGSAVGAIFVPAGLSAVGIKAFVRAYQIYTSPKFNIIRKAYADGRAAEVDIDGTPVLYDAGFSDEGLSLSFMNGFLLGPKAFKTPADVAKTVLHETYRLEARTDGPIGGEYATQETKEADEFANMGYKTLMEGAEAGESIGDDGGGEGVVGDG